MHTLLEALYRTLVIRFSPNMATAPSETKRDEKVSRNSSATLGRKSLAPPVDFWSEKGYKSAIDRVENDAKILDGNSLMSSSYRLTHCTCGNTTTHYTINIHAQIIIFLSLCEHA